MKRFVTTVAALGLLAGASVANACQLTGWDASNGAVQEGGFGSNPLSRYLGQCAMSASGAGDVFEQDQITDEAVINQRFYFFATGAGTSVTLYEAYSDVGGTNVIYSLTYDGTNVNYTTTDGGTSASAPVNGLVDWHSVELHWTANGTVDLYVDSNAAAPGATPDASGTSAAANTIASIRMGAIGGLGGFTQVGLDDYVGRRSSAIGRACPGDAFVPLDNTINVQDLQELVNEILGTAPCSGMCNANENLDTTINVQDLQLLVDFILGNATAEC